MPTASQLGVSDVLRVVVDIFNIDGEVHGTEFRFLCPVHSDVHPSADINLVHGGWSCFSCGVGGDLADLGVYVIKQLPEDALRMEREAAKQEIISLLKPGTPQAVLTSVQAKIRAARNTSGEAHRSPVRRLLPSPRSYAPGPLAYMRERGFETETLRRWGVRFVEKQKFKRADPKPDERKTFEITNSIGIPIRNAKGAMQAWVYRATGDSASWQPKVFYTPGFDLSSNWFGLHLHHREDEIFVVEGPLDAMWMDQHGLPALAMMGSNHKSPRKFRMLHDFRKVTVVPDYDAGGVFMAHRLGLLLRGQVPVYVARWPKAVVKRTGKETPDPQDVRKPEDLKLVAERAIPWQTWCLRNDLKTKEN